MDAEAEALERHIKERMRKRKLKKYGIRCGIVAGVVAVLLIPLAILGNHALKDVKYLKQEANVLKNQLKVSVECIKGEDYAGATEAINQVDLVVEELQQKLNEPLWVMAKGFPVYGKDVASMNQLIGLLGDASGDIIKPAIVQLSENPMNNLKVGDGFNVSLLLSYIDFADDMEPKVENLVDQLENITISDTVMKMVDKDGKINHYKEELVSTMDEYEEIKAYFPVFRTVLGDGSDRYYLLAAQNSSEIRASGGFPGSMGSIQIQDGVMTIGEFETVYDMLSDDLPAEVQISNEERNLFGAWYAERPRDACFNPDFGRVGYIWAKGFEAKQGYEVDGVIAMTPAIIQNILKMSGEITLSDGTVMNGSNATQVLQNDLYFKCFGTGANYSYADEITNALFAETAMKAMSVITEGFDIKNIKDYMNLFDDGMGNRTIMMWMADDEEESVMIESGCSGVLNTGTPNAVAGVYFSTPDPSKMGWYLQMDTEVGDSVKNEDGSRTYDVKVTFNNTIDYSSIADATSYILGSNMGSIEGYLYFVAPTDGTIGEFNASNGITISQGEYNGLQLGYNHLILIAPNTPVEITYKVTTAAGVDEPLTINSTPTLQQYRAE